MSPDYSRYKYLDIQRSNGIATLTLNQADNRNAVHAEMHGELEHVWRDLGSDPEVNVIVFTGAGKTFSAGGDIKRMAARFGTDEGWDYSLGIPAATHRMFEGILDVKQPIIAADNSDRAHALFADVIAAFGPGALETKEVVRGRLHSKKRWRPLACKRASPSAVGGSAENRPLIPTAGNAYE